MTGTLFLDSSKGWWLYSVRTASGFRHHQIARLNGCATRSDAEARLAECIERGDIPTEVAA